MRQSPLNAPLHLLAGGPTGDSMGHHKLAWFGREGLKLVARVARSVPGPEWPWAAPHMGQGRHLALAFLAAAAQGDDRCTGAVLVSCRKALGMGRRDLSGGFLHRRAEVQPELASMARGHGRDQEYQAKAIDLSLPMSHIGISLYGWETQGTSYASGSTRIFLQGR